RQRAAETWCLPSGDILQRKNPRGSDAGIRLQWQSRQSCCTFRPVCQRRTHSCANPLMMELSTSKSLFEKAQQFVPGGVNSPVRAFRAVGGTPVFIRSASGAYLYDEDGNRYVDLINSWGPMILGHANPEVEGAVIEAVRMSASFGCPTAREVEMGALICSMVPSVEKVRMVNSGTEATMSAVRL